MLSLKSSLVMALLPHLMDAAGLRPRDVQCSFSTSASSGDTCESFAGGWGLSVADFQALNPGVTCPNLIAGQDYCVIGTVTTPVTTNSSTSIKPTTTTSSSKTSSTTSTKPTTSSTSSTKTTSTTSKTSTTTTTTPAGPTNTMPGLAPNCNKMYLVASGDTCAVIQSKYSISAAQFAAWNTFVDSTCSNLWLGYYVCVGVPGATTTTSTSTKPTPTPTCPDPQMPSIVSNCKKCRLVQSGDTCDVIDKAAGISLANFLKWNPFVDANCSNLWLGYYVCVGV